MFFRLYYIFPLLLLTTLMFGQEKFYQMPDDQIFPEEIYTQIRPQIIKSGAIIMLYDSLQRNDTTFYRVGIKPDFSKQRNPYKKFMNQIGEKFPLELFGIEKSDKPIFINFWFTSCAPCIKEIPDLNELAAEYENRARFVAITFNTEAQVEKFLEARPINFEHITNQNKALSEYGVRSYPMNILIDKNANILYVDGMLNYTKWEVEMLLDRELGENKLQL